MCARTHVRACSTCNFFVTPVQGNECRQNYFDLFAIHASMVHPLTLLLVKGTCDSSLFLKQAALKEANAISINEGCGKLKMLIAWWKHGLSLPSTTTGVKGTLHPT